MALLDVASSPSRPYPRSTVARIALAAPALALTAAALALWEIHHPALPTTFELGPAAATARDAVAIAHERLPAMAGSLLALATVCAFVGWTVSARAAACTALVGLTMPLAFVPARLRWGGLAGGALASLLTPRTFEQIVPALAYGLGPWVLFAPFALVARSRSRGALALSVAASLAVLAFGLAGARLGLTVPVVAPFLAPLMAGRIGVELAALSSRARPSSTARVATVAGIGWLVVHDLGTSPERLLAPLVTLDASGTAAIAVAATHAAKLAQGLLAVTTLVVCVAVWLPRAMDRRVSVPLRTALVAAPVLAGLALRVGVYPALLAHASPSVALETWAARRQAGDALATVGVDARLLASTEHVDLASASAAGAWLAAVEPSTSRRWLAMPNRAAGLAEANASFRATRHTNLPLLVGGDETTLLATSALRPGETDGNPLDRIVLDQPPPDLRPLAATIGGAVTVLGWQLTDDDGQLLASVPARGRHARNARLRVVLRVDAPPGDGACTFVHVDHQPSRFADEHRELAYPLRLWTPGEIIVDEYAVALAADVSAGRYPLFWGMGVLPCEDDRRREVTSGPSDGHGRVALGTLEVR